MQDSDDRDEAEESDENELNEHCDDWEEEVVADESDEGEGIDVGGDGAWEAGDGKSDSYKSSSERSFAGSVPKSVRCAGVR